MISNEKHKKRIYLDHAATTPVDRRVLKAMLPLFSEDFGNPGSLHKEGVRSKSAVLSARVGVANILGVAPNEIIFTSSGTESNNLAILGLATHPELKGYALGDLHFITSTIEHNSVLECFKELQKRGARVSFVSVKKDGVLDLKEFERALGPKTVLVSIMFVNNEIGTVQPINEIEKIIRKHEKMGTFTRKVPGSDKKRPVFHTDASQAPLYFSLKSARLGVDMITLDAQKVYGPKGVGLLYRKKDISLKPLFFGGEQEYGLRPSTENVPGVVGFSEALKIAEEEREKESVRLRNLRDECIKQILEIAPGAELNGSHDMRSPNNINISFPGTTGEWIVFQLDARGIAVGSRSACMSGDDAGSYVITALGKDMERATSSVRITLGRATRKEDINSLVSALADILKK